MQVRRLPLSLPPDEYERLRQIAEAEDRDPVQQARWILRRALAHATQGTVTAPAMNRAIDDRIDS